jgi:two-component system CheB/CheR fusion protein
LEVHFQPVVLTDTQECIGAEALVRWNHLSRGWIAPEKFISIAEDNHLIHTLGEWVLQTACTQMKAWRKAGLILDFIAINVSGKQLMQSDFVSLAKNVFSSSDCPASCVTFELTESFVMRESEGAITKLKALRDLGVGIAIDDFGTGYSSLSYLKRLPVTKLKLDRSFVRDIPEDSSDVAISRAILKLAEAVGLDVVAEGVETEGQSQFLQTEGCRYGQGYLYAKPMSADDFTRFFDKL